MGTYRNRQQYQVAKNGTVVIDTGIRVHGVEDLDNVDLDVENEKGSGDFDPVLGLSAQKVILVTITENGTDDCEGYVTTTWVYSTQL